MGRTVFAELDRITFSRIRNTKNASGMIDEDKFFKGLDVGDSVVFSCGGRKIEAYLRNIKIYESMGEYLKENKDMGVLEINSKNPMTLLNMMGSVTDKPKKRMRIFEVDYHPYGDDEEEDVEEGGGGADIESFLQKILDASYNKDDDEY